MWIDSPGVRLGYAGALWERVYAIITNTGAKSLYTGHPMHRQVFPAVGRRVGALPHHALASPAEKSMPSPSEHLPGQLCEPPGQ